MQRGNFEGDEVVCSGPVVGISPHTVDLPATKQLSGPLNFFSEKSPLLCHLLSEFFAHLLSFIMAALWNRAGHYILILWFFLLISFFSSPILSRHRLDVYHTSTHDVALVRI